MFWDNKSPEQIAFSPEYKKEVERLDNLTLDYISRLEKGEMSISEYSEVARNHLALYKPNLKAISKHRSKLNKEHSFRGRGSFRFWIFVFGLVTALLYFAAKSLFDEFSRGSTFKHQFVSVSGIVVACFWIVHLVFYTQKDFAKNTYFLTIFICALLMSVFVYHLVKYYTYKDQIIYNLLDFIERVKTKHINRLGTKSYYADRNDEPMVSLDTTKDNIEDFDNDLNETLKRVI